MPRTLETLWTSREWLSQVFFYLYCRTECRNPDLWHSGQFLLPLGKKKTKTKKTALLHWWGFLSVTNALTWRFLWLLIFLNELQRTLLDSIMERNSKSTVAEGGVRRGIAAQWFLQETWLLRPAEANGCIYSKPFHYRFSCVCVCNHHMQKLNIPRRFGCQYFQSKISSWWWDLQTRLFRTGMIWSIVTCCIYSNYFPLHTMYVFCIVIILHVPFALQRSFDIVN